MAENEVYNTKMAAKMSATDMIGPQLRCGRFAYMF